MYEADIDMNDVVYPGGAAPILRALMADEVDVGVVSAAEALSQVEDGELRYLALMSESKSELFPSVPLLEDSGFDISHSTWRGLAAPRGTPEEIINLLDETIAEIVKDEEFIEFMHNNRFGIKYRNSEQFGEFMRSERDNLIELSEVLENE
jgi:tripartite-type tricarboxylate transporter receptor subunit TctC